jgi:Coenzyme F390 synthetase
MIWNETVECMDREQLREIQSRRLVKMAEYVYYNTPFYRKKFQEMGLEPGDIKSIDDIVKLPFTNKLDLRDNYPFGLAAVPMSQIVRIHASSGTTGKPVLCFIPVKTWPHWSEAIVPCFHGIRCRQGGYLPGGLWLWSFHWRLGSP